MVRVDIGRSARPGSFTIGRIAKETGVPLEDARATVDSYPFKVAQVLPEDIKREQELSDAFLEAGEIKKQVDVATITDNLLPDGFDSAKLS